MPRCDVPDERLIAYLDGYLADPAWRTLAAHLPTCPGCRARVEAFREVEQILRSAPPPLDGARVRRAVAARLRAEAGRARQRRAPRLALAVGALLLVLAVLAPVSSTAGFDFGRFLRFGHVAVERTGDTETAVGPDAAADAETPAADAPAFRAVAPARLPLGLELAARTLPDPTRLELRYGSPDGMVISLVESPVGSTIALEASAGQTTIRVAGTEVLVLTDPRQGAIAGLLWERDGVVFELLVIGAPVGGLPLADGVRIVEALIAEQDAA